MRNYNTIINRNKNNFIKITITEEKRDKIESFIPLIIAEKQKEAEHRFDCFNEEKRWRTGLYGEAAIEQLFNINVIDWEVGSSEKFGRPDLKGYKVGVKTVELGSFPIIKKRNTYPQIICIKDGYSVWVCGLAETGILNNFQDDSLILSPRLRAKGYKTGFYGFDYLIKINTLTDLEDYKND